MRGHRPRPRRGDRRVVRRRATTARSSTSCARSGCASRRTRTTGRVEGPLTGQQYVITGHARVVHARGGAGGARGARREGLRQRLEEDDGRRRRREPGLEGREGAEGGRAAAHRGRPPRAARRRLSGSPRISSCRERERLREAVLRRARRPRRDRASRSARRRTRSGRADVARERRRDARSCPSSRARGRARAALAAGRSSVPLTPATGSEPRAARAGRVVPGGDEQRRELPRGHAVRAREPEPSTMRTPRERHARRARGRAARRAAPAAVVPLPRRLARRSPSASAPR